MTLGDALSGEITGRLNSPSGNRDIGLHLMVGCFAGTSGTTPLFFLYGEYFANGTGQTGTSEPKLVTFTSGGQSYVGVMLDGNRTPSGVLFDGHILNTANDALIGRWVLAADVTGIAEISSNMVFKGRPGDAAGSNAVLFSPQSGFGTAVNAGRIETGTWTPSLAGTSTPGTHTYSSRLGSYIKRGPLVQLTFDVVTSAIDGGWAGNAVIAGLPFAVNTPAGATQGATLIPHCQGITLPATPYGLSANPSASTLILQTSAGSPVGAPAALAVSAFTAGTNRLRGTLTYRAANV